MISTKNAVQALEYTCSLQFANLCPEHDERFCKKVSLCLQQLGGQRAAVQMEMQMKSYQPWSGAPLHPDGAGVLDAVCVARGVLLSVNAGAVRSVSTRYGGHHAIALQLLYS